MDRVRALVEQRFEADERTHAPASVARRPTIERLDDGTVLFHYRYDCYAQSGSDWGVHTIVLATVCDDLLVVLRSVEQTIPESALGDYDDAAEAARQLAAWRG